MGVCKQLICIGLSITLVSGSILPNFAFGDEVASEPAGQDEQGTLQVPEAEGEAEEQEAVSVVSGDGVSDTSSDSDSDAVSSPGFVDTVSDFVLAADEYSVMPLAATSGGFAGGTGDDGGFSGTSLTTELLALQSIARSNAVIANILDASDSGSLYFYISGIYSGIGNLNSKLTTVNTNIGTVITWLQNIWNAQGSIYGALSYTDGNGFFFDVTELVYRLMVNQAETNDLLDSSLSVYDNREGYKSYYSVGFSTYYTLRTLEQVSKDLAGGLWFKDEDGNWQTVAENAYKIFLSLSYTNADGFSFNVSEMLYRLMVNQAETNDLLDSSLSVYDNREGYQDYYSVGFSSYWSLRTLQQISSDLGGGLWIKDEDGVWQTVANSTYQAMLYLEDILPNSNLVVEFLKNFDYTDGNGLTFKVPEMLYRIMIVLNDANSNLAGIADNLVSLMESLGVDGVEPSPDEGDSSEGFPDYTEQLKGIQTTLTGILAGVAILDAYVIWDDITDEFDEATDGGAQNFSALTSGLRDLGLVLQRAFPFSLIFDFAFLIGLFIAPAQAPSFTIEFPNGVGGSVPYEIDLSEYEPVASGFRTLMSISYGLALIFLTRKFIWRSGGEN